VTKSQWEDRLRSWAAPPGKTEEQRCENAVNAIKNAIAASTKLKQRGVSVILQGSYRNNTNVRGESDVDIGVVCDTTFFYQLPDQMTPEQFGLIASDYQYSTFKSEVGEALTSYFGSQAVKRGNKAFDVKETSYHVEADVAPFFTHRHYAGNASFAQGVELQPDNKTPPRVINWPDQHYENGVTKNNATGRRYKAMVRVLKSLRNDMRGKRVAAAEPAIGFLIECLIWNVPNPYFGAPDYYEDLRGILVFLFSATKTDEACREWREVSERKHLFGSHQRWTRQQAHDFIIAAWQHVGFKAVEAA